MSDRRAVPSHGKVLVLGSGTGAFLAAIRSLGRGGLEVHVGWESPGAPALRSRYVHRFHAIAPVVVQSHEWVTQLADLMRRERFDLVMATDEAGVRALHEHAAELGQWGALAGASHGPYRILSDEAQLAQLARTSGLRVPESRLVRVLADGAGLDAELGLPLDLEHAVPDEADGRWIERPPLTVSEPAAYGRLLEAMLKDGPVTVRQRIAGPLVGVGLLLDEGEPLLAFGYQHVHEPLHEARGSYVRSVRLDPELAQAAIDLMRVIAYTGVVAVECRRGSATDAWVLTSVSTSLRGSLPLALAAGADFPMGLYRLLAQGAPPARNAYRSGVHSRHLTGDVLWLLFRLRAAGNGPGSAARLLWDAVVELARNVLLRREHLDAFSIDDPAPLVMELGQTVGTGFKLVRRRARRRLAASSVLRRRLARPATRAVRDADRVLFVCAGNICRSPFAERRARALGIFPEVASAGHDAFEDSRSPHLAIRAAAEWDVQLDPHRAHRLVEADARAADVIFVFDEDNEQRVIDAFPFARDRVHFIGALRRRGSLFVDDPFGGELGTFQRSYAEIEAALDQMARLRGGHQGRR